MALRAALAAAFREGGIAAMPRGINEYRKVVCCVVLLPAIVVLRMESQLLSRHKFWELDFMTSSGEFTESTLCMYVPLELVTASIAQKRRTKKKTRWIAHSAHARSAAGREPQQRQSLCRSPFSLHPDTMSRKRSPAVIEDPAEDGSPSQRKQRVGEQDKENLSENDAPPAEPRTINPVNPASRPPEAGVIKKVYVENFMCHRKFTVDLCRNVNFIHGQNGSGKSAVLAAIQICLGAGARRTHRARNLKELIRKEAGDTCSGAKVRVTLLNGGPDGFQQDVYGDTITVERTISLRAGGSSGYKLLDDNGVSKSSSKQDLDAMLDHLNIQVENPVAVLDQEEAKKFLTGKPEDKYEFFAKATELERIDRSYANVIDNIEQLQNTKEKVEQSLKGKVENVRLLKKEWEQYQELDKLEEKVLDYRVDYAWAFYSSVQNDVEIEEEVHNLQRICFICACLIFDRVSESF
jgi:recombinational DNA repair ATPase RecF